MIEIKAINPPPFTVEVTDMDGKKHVWKGKVITRKNQAEVLAAEKEITGNPDPNEGTLYRFAALYFGGTPDDYDNFDIRVVTAAVREYSRDLANPTM